MANYNNLQDALNAGITNMTCHRNNSAQDDGTDTISNGPSWFYLNGRASGSIYASGNSWLGFGQSTEQMKVNRRDCKMFYLYSETGVIGRTQFFKIRWRGQSHYSDYSDEAAQQFDLFLLSNGQIYLNYYDVPTNNFSGIHALVCGSQTVSYAVTAGVACEYTFTASDPATGTGWSVEAGRPVLEVTYKTYGTAAITVTQLGSITDYKSSKIAWTESTPEGTSITVSAKVTGGQYQACTNNGSVPCLVSGEDYTGKSLFILVELATTDTSLSPGFSGLSLTVHDANDDFVIFLNFSPGNRNGFQNAVGDITVHYLGGTLMGRGGPVLEFTETFTPESLTFKGDQNDAEHIEVGNITAVPMLRRISYINGKCDEHIELTVSASSNLINIHDI